MKLSESLVAIPEECFSLCSLEELTIPKNVKIIGNRAFRSAWVSHIEIPEGVEIIGYDAFEALESIFYRPHYEKLNRISTMKSVLIPQIFPLTLQFIQTIPCFIQKMELYFSKRMEKLPLIINITAKIQVQDFDERFTLIKFGNRYILLPNLYFLIIKHLY